MDLSPIGRAVLKSREGEVLTAYKDSVGILTIGVGITTASGLIKVTPGLTITAATSDALFTEAVKAYAKPVSDLGVKLEQHQFDALVSLCFNIGQPAFTRSTVAKRLREGNVAGAAEAILMWNKPAAIISRRQGEYDQFRTPYAIALPKARRGDRSPVKAPNFMAPVPAPAPAVLPKPVPPVAEAPAQTGALGGWLSSLFRWAS
ncbi:lysozyme [Methylorubrum extorquens]|uniref:Lysozyme n=1 Tax=Methylorubrum extorquens (strain ATCC 14718 / DSM 1338 / JCM 2805 / NCIMB 9133 / AM1) TaxID=272630 RepID=C5B186_METEA|nr:lysozyme [Methylorubrum extorquens]ACS41687.1 Phage-related lysozyme (Muramidase, Endolysin) [Methylorubrum extorquens AM1]MCP1545299.1 lysozyme [Methylorubrum extorquens]MCP1587354.1 lysozyme [Methylorubrum extorquens]